MTLKVFPLTTLIQVDLIKLIAHRIANRPSGGFWYVQKTCGPQKVAKRTSNSDTTLVSIQVA